MQALRDVGVLVTRPEHQAAPLCHLLELQGARTLRFPALEMQAAGNPRDTAARLSAIGKFDAVIFTSSNAVRFGASLLDQGHDLTLGALGPATARALNQAGYQVAIQPQSTFDSENLLLHPRLEHPAGLRLLIVTGCGGRAFLAQELLRRGAAVEIAEVYRRVPANPSAAALGALLNSLTAGAVQVITATSVEIARSLISIATAPLRREFERLHWLLPAGRVAAGVRELGVSSPQVQANSAEDHDLVDALVRWRSIESGA